MTPRLHGEALWRRRIKTAALLIFIALYAFVVPEEASGPANLVIAGIYLLLAYLTRNRLNLPYWVAVGTQMFFLGCAGTHLENALHTFMGEPVPTDTWHHHFIHALQVVGGAMAIYGAIYHRIKVIDLRTALERRRDEARAKAEAKAKAKADEGARE